MLALSQFRSYNLDMAEAQKQCCVAGCGEPVAWRAWEADIEALEDYCDTHVKEWLLSEREEAEKKEGAK